TRDVARTVVTYVKTCSGVKTSINDKQHNRTRIRKASGKSPARVVDDKLAAAFEDQLLVERGMLRDGPNHERIRETMTRPAYTITIDLGLGRGEAHVFTCDLSEEYVRINAKYTT